MNYINVEKGCFCRRPNRFIAEVQLGDGIAVCHVKNTDRCREPVSYTHLDVYKRQIKVCAMSWR